MVVCMHGGWLDMDGCSAGIIWVDIDGDDVYIL